MKKHLFIIMIAAALPLAACGPDEPTGYRKTLAKDFRYVCMGQIEQQTRNAGRNWDQIQTDRVAAFCECVGNKVAAALSDKEVEAAKKYDDGARLPIEYLGQSQSFLDKWQKAAVKCGEKMQDKAL
ncbi:MAG: hypothetical protein FWC61_03015 [Proteobacteria bacterium]|nr:hypothetical protein [Pseudomonadota bacterium]